MTRVEFADFTSEEQKIVDKIVKRAHAMFLSAGVSRRKQDIEMDVSATHARNPLRLQELLDADDFNFAHDLSGIARHLNRKTGELDDLFSPRFTDVERVRRRRDGERRSRELRKAAAER